MNWIKYYVRGNEVPSLGEYMRIRKADKSMNEKLIKEIFNKVSAPHPVEFYINKWREAEPYTLEEFKLQYGENGDLMKLFQDILDSNQLQ